MHFDLYVPIQSDADQLEFNRIQQLGVEDWTQILDLYQTSDLPGQSLELYVYLPNVQGLRLLQNDIETKIKKVFETANNPVRLRIILRFIDGSPDGPAPRLAEDLYSNEPITHDQPNVFEKLLAAADVSTENAKKVRKWSARTRFAALFLTRAYQTASALPGGGPPALAAALLLIGEPALEYYTIDQIRQIQEKFARLSEKILKPLAGRFAKPIGVPVLNLSLFSIAWPLAAQALTHQADTSVPAPDLGSALNVGTVVGFDTLFYVWIFTRGYEKLRAKGWMTNSQIDTLLQVMSVPFFINGIISSNPNWYHLRYFTLIPVWTTYAAVGLAGALAPARKNRIVMLESSLRPTKNILNEQFFDLDNNVRCQDELASEAAK